MRVQAMPLWLGVSITLLQEDGGWRFGSWSKFTQDLPQPPPEECAKWFATAEEAVAHFRTLCPRDICE